MSLVDAIAKNCAGYRLPQNLVIALARVQSDMTMSATHYDVDYRWMWDCDEDEPFRRLEDFERHDMAPSDFIAPPNCDTPTTEWIGQKMRWGPFLVHGAILRERRYWGPFAVMCSDPEKAARFACSHLSNLHDRYFARHGWAGVVAAFDAGRPRKDEFGDYVNSDFLKRVGQVKNAAPLLGRYGS